MSETTTDAQKSTERYGIGRGRIDSENKNESETNEFADERARARLQDQCRSCERELPAKTARVCGDNDGCVPECKHCVDYHITGDNQGRHNTAAIAFRAHAERDRGGDES
jgi:hypothetical protein